MKLDLLKPMDIEQRRDFLLQGRVLNIVWFLAWPVLLQMLLHLLVQTVDMKMVGVLGAGAVASMGMSMQLLNILAVSAMGVSTGVTAAVSYYYGKNDHRSTVDAAAQGVILALVISGMIMIAVFFASGQLLQWLGAEENIRLLADGYVKVFTAGILFFVGRFTLWAVFQGIGDNRTPLRLDLLTNVINVIGNYIFIFGAGPIPAFGVIGAAMGTVLAHSIGISWAFYLIRGKAFARVPLLRELVAFKRGIMAMVLRIGIPVTLQMLIQAGANTIILGLVARTAASTYAVSGYSVGLLIFSYAMFPAAAVGHAASTMVGVNLGASNNRRAHRSGWACARVGVLLIALFSLLIYFNAHRLIGFFVADPRVINAGVPLVRTLAVVEPLHAMGMILARAFYVAGETKIPFIISLCSWLIIRVPLAWFLAFYLGWQGPGIWYAIAFSQVFAALLMLWFYYRGVGFNLSGGEKNAGVQPAEMDSRLQ